MKDEKVRDTIVYGIHPVEELITQRLSSIDHIYFDKEKHNAQIFNLMKLCRKERLAYNLVPATRIDHQTGTTKHQGVMAICSAKPYASLEEVQEVIKDKQAGLLVVAASIEDPNNLGSIIRSSAAFGAHALMLEKKNSTPLSAAVAKSSAGMIEKIPISRPKNLEQFLKDLTTAGYQIIGAHAHQGKLPYEFDFKQPTVIITGGENKSIPPYLMRLCTGFCSIPLMEGVESLNVANAASVLLYEAARQREFKY